MRAIETQIMKKDLGRLSLSEDDIPNGGKDMEVDDEFTVPVKAKLRSIGYGDNAGKLQYEFDITDASGIQPAVTVDPEPGSTVDKDKKISPLSVAGRKIVR